VIKTSSRFDHWRARAGAGSAHSAEHRVTGPNRTFCDGHHIGMAAAPISILPKAGWTAFRFPQSPSCPDIRRTCDLPRAERGFLFVGAQVLRPFREGFVTERPARAAHRASAPGNAFSTAVSPTVTEIASPLPSAVFATFRCSLLVARTRWQTERRSGAALAGPLIVIRDRCNHHIGSAICSRAGRLVTMIEPSVIRTIPLRCQLRRHLFTLSRVPPTMFASSRWL
jgi:hypothetical protein